MTAKEWLKAYKEKNGTIPLDTILEEAAKFIENIDEAENEEFEDYFENTSKIFKFSGYYIDSNALFDVDDVKTRLEEGLADLIAQHIKVESADIGEWDEDNPLNFDDCDIKECEKWFE